MTTIRDLIAAGFDPDTEILVRRNDEDDIAFGSFHEVRHTDAISSATVLVLTPTDEYTLIADEDDDELEWQHALTHGVTYGGEVTAFTDANVMPVDEGFVESLHPPKERDTYDNSH